MTLLHLSCALLAVGFAMQSCVILRILNRLRDVEVFRDAFLDSISKITNEVPTKMDTDQEVPE